MHLHVCTSINNVLGPLDGCMTCDFASFSTVFQSYQDDIRAPFMVERISPRAGIEPGPLDQ